MSREEVTRVVYESIASILPAVPAETIRGDRHIKDLGADSVDRVEIILLILDRLRVDEPMSSFSDIPDIDSLVDFLFRVKRS